MGEHASGGAASPTGLLVGQLAALAGVTVKAVRHYEQLGLIAPASREDNGYKRYAPETAIRVACIASLGRAGIPLARVADVLDAPQDSEATLDTVLSLLHDQRDRLTAQIEALGSLRAAVVAGEGPVEELGKPVVTDIQASLGDLAHTIDDRVWALERRVLGLLGAIGVAVDSDALRRFVAENRVEVAAVLAADAAFAALRDAAADDPRVPSLAQRMHELRPVAEAMRHHLTPPTTEGAAALGGLIQPRLSAAQRRALRLAASLGSDGA